MESIKKNLLRFYRLLEKDVSTKPTVAIRMLILYLLACFTLKTATNVLVMMKYTFKLNCGVINWFQLWTTFMQFIIIFCGKGAMPSDQISCLLGQVEQKKLEKTKFIYISMILLCSLFIIVSSFKFVSSNGASAMYYSIFGIDGSEVVEPAMKWILLVSAITANLNMAFTILIFALRYSSVLEATSLLTQQNLHIMNKLLMKCELAEVKDLTFKTIEDMYLAYIRIVRQVNTVHGRVPLWFLMMIYICITMLGSYIVVSDGKTSLMPLLTRNGICLAVVLVFTLRLITLCTRCHSNMEQFREQGIQLINTHVRRSESHNAMRKCLENTLRSIPLVKMQAGQMYDMENSLMISLVASAIPTTVMIVSLIKQLN